MGYMTLVYDNLNKQWAGMDITSATISGIKMFALTNTASSHSIFCCTLDNKIHQLLAGSSRECGTLVMRSFVSGSYSVYATFIPNSLRAEHATRYMKVQVTQGKEDGTLTAIEQVDLKRGQYMTKSVKGAIAGISYPVFPPVIPDNTVRALDVLFPLDRGERGYKISPTLVWTGDMTIDIFELETEDARGNQSQAQQTAGMTPANKL